MNTDKTIKRIVLNERLTDNGEHSHWELINQDNEILWSEALEESLPNEIADFNKRSIPQKIKNKIVEEANWRSTNGHGGVNDVARDNFIQAAEFGYLLAKSQSAPSGKTEFTKTESAKIKTKKRTDKQLNKFQ